MDNSFTTFTPYVNRDDRTWWGWGGFNGDHTPAVWMNTSGDSICGSRPGQLSLHPGDGFSRLWRNRARAVGVSGPVQILDVLSGR